MKRLTILVCMLALTLSSAADAAIQWKKGAGGNDHYYEIRQVDGGIDWADAGAKAIFDGGYLVTITSDAERTFVYDNLANHAQYWRANNGGGFTQFAGPWIGAYQDDAAQEPAQGWFWTNAEGAVDPGAWPGGEPNDFNGNEDCGMFYNHANNTTPVDVWNDVPCGFLAESYIVEWDQKPKGAPGLLAPAAAALGAVLAVAGAAAARKRVK